MSNELSENEKEMLVKFYKDHKEGSDKNLATRCPMFALQIKEKDYIEVNVPYDVVKPGSGLYFAFKHYSYEDSPERLVRSVTGESDVESFDGEDVEAYFMKFNIIPSVCAISEYWENVYYSFSYDEIKEIKEKYIYKYPNSRIYGFCPTSDENSTYMTFRKILLDMGEVLSGQED